MENNSDEQLLADISKRTEASLLILTQTKVGWQHDREGKPINHSLSDPNSHHSLILHWLLLVPVVLVPGCDGTGSDQELHSPNRCMWPPDGSSFRTRMPSLNLKLLDYHISVYIHAQPPYPVTHLWSNPVTQPLQVILGCTLNSFRQGWSQNSRQTVSLAQLDCFTPNSVSQEESLTRGWDALINIAINNSEIMSGQANLFSSYQERIVWKQHYSVCLFFVVVGGHGMGWGKGWLMLQSHAKPLLCTISNNSQQLHSSSRWWETVVRPRQSHLSLTQMAHRRRGQQVEFRAKTSPRSGRAFTRATGNPGQRVACLVGLDKTRLVWGPRGLGFNSPDLNDEPRACHMLKQ